MRLRRHWKRDLQILEELANKIVLDETSTKEEIVESVKSTLNNIEKLYITPAREVDCEDD